MDSLPRPRWVGDSAPLIAEPAPLMALPAPDSALPAAPAMEAPQRGEATPPPPLPPAGGV